MNVTELKLEYDVCENNRDGIPAIIVAAGNSSRMGGIDKQFASLLGIPVIARTLLAFEKCSAVSKIIVVTSKEHICDVQIICDKYMISKVTDITSGGKNRHDSVMCGISRLDTGDDRVLIHDGARPLVDNDTIINVAEALKNCDAAVCVSKINDTVKKIDENGNIISTVDRSNLYSAQTPQGVNLKKYIAACETVEKISDFTDDSSVMEAAGFNVKAICGKGKNIKITTPDDLIFAEALLRSDSICE